jgi:hypothetical protein
MAHSTGSLALAVCPFIPFYVFDLQRWTFPIKEVLRIK